MPDEKAPSLGAFLPSSLMHHLSGEPMHDLSGVDTGLLIVRLGQYRCQLKRHDASDHGSAKVFAE
jgi:hypothetical protein